MSSQSADKLKPQMAFELFELVGLLRVRPRVSQQHSKGKLVGFSFCCAPEMSFFSRPWKSEHVSAGN